MWNCKVNYSPANSLGNNPNFALSPIISIHTLRSAPNSRIRIDLESSHKTNKKMLNPYSSTATPHCDLYSTIKILINLKNLHLTPWLSMRWDEHWLLFIKTRLTSSRKMDTTRKLFLYSSASSSKKERLGTSHSFHNSSPKVLTTNP